MFLVYFVYELGLHFLRNDVGEYLTERFSISSIVNFLLLNKPIAADHSWYMWAMIYTLLICLIIPKIVAYRPMRIVCILIPLALQLIFGKYAILIWGKEFPSILTRNVWTVGFPYFLVGVEIRHSKFIKHSSKKYWTYCLLFSLLCIIEQRILINTGLNAARDSYIFTAPLAACFFMAFATMRQLANDNTLVQWGIKYSLPFYILHPLLVKIEVRIFKMDTIEQYFGVLAVLVVSLLLSMMYYWISQRMPNKSKLR